MAALYARHRAQVYGLCLRMVRDRQEAMELCQDAFLSALGKWDTFEYRSEPLTWIISVARNACLNHLRRRATYARRLETLHGEGGRPFPARGCNPEELIVSGLLFDQTLARVGHSTRQVLIRYYRDGLNRSEIAGELGVTPAAVSKVISQMEAAWRMGRMSRCRPRMARKARLEKAPEGGRPGRGRARQEAAHGR